MVALPYVVCDVFTDRPLAGNQLAAFPDADGIDPATMQALAREMNFSETVFVVAPQAGGEARLRIFTPVSEIPFAGHPTLGAAFVLGSTRRLEVVRLETGSGSVRVQLERDGERVVFGWMEQPLPTVEEFEPQAELLEALGVAESELPIEVYDNGLRHAFVALGSEAEVAALRPNMERLAQLPALGVSTFASKGNRCKTRMFAPAGGVPEDPATGSAAGPLAYHLARHGRIAFGAMITISQGVEIGRPSTLHARVEGSSDRLERILVGGSAVIVAHGEFRLPAS